VLGEAEAFDGCLPGCLLVGRFDCAEDFPAISDQHRLPPTQLGFLWSGHGGIDSSPLENRASGLQSPVIVAAWRVREGGQND
jgi:hypothetical protein